MTTPAEVTPEVRRANIRLLIALIIFALLLTATVLLWMRSKIRANGGVVDPAVSAVRVVQPPAFVANSRHISLVLSAAESTI